MSDNNVILVTSSYDHTFLFWEASNGSTIREI